MKFNFKGTRPSKIQLKGKIQLFWILFIFKFPSHVDNNKQKSHKSDIKLKLLDKLEI